MREVAKFTTRLVKFENKKDLSDFLEGGNLAKVVIDGELYYISPHDKDGCMAISDDESLPEDEVVMMYVKYCNIDLDSVVGALYDGETDGDYSGYNFEGC